MTLQQLKYAIVVADHPSMCDAAKSLYISQPSLTNTIHDLEKDIGITIFARTNKGITITPEGDEFLGYARQVVERSALLEEKYNGEKTLKQRFSVSTQHYSFAVKAFVKLLERFGLDDFDFSLREIRTYEIIEDVAKMRSEIGILYLNDYNEDVISKLIKENDLEFIHLFTAKPHVFISTVNPLSGKKKIKLEELEKYPYLCFEQGSYNSFYFSEEILSTMEHRKKITVSDRATLFNLLIGSNGYTFSTGVIDNDLNGDDIIAIPLDVPMEIRVGYIMRKNVIMSRLAQIYIEALKEQISKK